MLSWHDRLLQTKLPWVRLFLCEWHSILLIWFPTRSSRVISIVFFPPASNKTFFLHNAKRQNGLDNWKGLSGWKTDSGWVCRGNCSFGVGPETDVLCPFLEQWKNEKRGCSEFCSKFQQWSDATVMPTRLLCFVHMSPQWICAVWKFEVIAGKTIGIKRGPLHLRQLHVKRVYTWAVSLLIWTDSWGTSFVCCFHRWCH